MAEQYLESLLVKAPASIELVNGLHEYHRKRLWHQLTSQMVKFITDANVKRPVAAGGVDLLEFYQEFVSTFAIKLNQLYFVQIAIAIANSGQIEDKQSRVDFLESVSELPKVVSHSEATIVVKSAIVENCVVVGDLTKAKERLVEAQASVDEATSVSSPVYSAFYRAWAAFYDEKKEYANFYQSALKYLGYTKIESLGSEEASSLALKLGVAALLGKDVYNFGDLMEHEVLTKLPGTPNEWMLQVLQTFNSGDISAWKEQQNSLSQQLNSQPALVKEHLMLDKKIAILALMEMVFAKPSHDRTVTFDQIAKQTQVAANDVEFLVMHALAMKLIQGSIDQVNSKVEITWVQPRILSLPQIQNVGERLGEWQGNVKGALSLMENELTPELIGA
eukprot:TRINITY_DN3012_c0_g1_i1.p1 TRINITY_DN3012_c0_g1~~TRINITY_DN3012_c0_g1_i1.p1  ORF type:complete len:391 (-),score=101.59 TRINITY_DN3012_c0_g1_i1:108-1280(-)